MPPSPTPSSATPTLGRVVMLVRDYDEALAFYAAAFGAMPLHDTTEGDERYVHVGFPGEPGADVGRATVGLWFLQARAPDERALVGRQTGGHPSLVLYTTDCRAAVDRVQAAGGRVRREVRSAGGATFAHVLDLYGNELVLVELE